MGLKWHDRRAATVGFAVPLGRSDGWMDAVYVYETGQMRSWIMDAGCWLLVTLPVGGG